MKHTFIRAVLIGVACVVASAFDAPAQTPAAAPRPAAQSNSATADEDFELDIDQRRISEQDFHAETSVEAGGAEPGGLNLRVGAAVRASNIELLLRNVRGRVRFRANLGPVLRLFDARRVERAPPPPQVNTSP